MMIKSFRKCIACICVLAVSGTMFPADTGRTVMAAYADAAVITAGQVDDKFTEAYNRLATYEVDKITEDLDTYASPGNIWNVAALARSGKMTAEIKNTFISKMRETVKESSGVVDNKTIITLAAMGADVQDFEGYNLLESLSDFDTVIGYGLTNAAYALIALDTRKYEVPAVSGDKEQTTREKLVKYMLEAQLEDGGWSWGTVSDADTTGMVIQALAPYGEEDEQVRIALDQAVHVLSTLQQESGGYKSADSEWGGVVYPGELNCESTAQVWWALTALAVDVSDERFIKGSSRIEDGLLGFQLADGSFSHTLNEDGSGETDYGFATPQAFCAMTAYERWKNGKTAFFDMTDTAVDVPSKEEENPVTPTPDGPKVTVKRQKITSIKSPKKKQILVKFTKMSNASSYQVQYSVSPKFAKKKTSTVTTKKTEYTMKKLTSGKIYYVRVRTCQRADGRNYYGSYSKVKKIKVK